MNALGVFSCCGFFVALVLFGLWNRFASARRSGWRRLRARYPAVWRPSGRQFLRASAIINGHVYRDELTVGLSGAGIYLSTPPLFRSFHRSVFVPWDDITPSQPNGRPELAMTIGDLATVIVDGRIAKVAKEMSTKRAGREQTWQI